jgi:hypothetical protein
MLPPPSATPDFDFGLGTYHWDVAGEGHGPDNPHGGEDHLQIHTFEGPIVRIYFGGK